MWNYLITNSIREEIELDYRNLNDNELVFLAQEKNEQANTILHEKYKPLITKKSTRIYRYVKGKE